MFHEKVSLDDMFCSIAVQFSIFHQINCCLVVFIYIYIILSI